MFAVFKVRAPGVHAGMDASGFVVPINSGATKRLLDTIWLICVCDVL